MEEPQTANLSFEGVINNYNAMVQLVNENFALKATNKQLLEMLEGFKAELEELKNGPKRNKR
jgi:hypothetical protein